MPVMSRNPKYLVYDGDKINNALVRDLVFSLLLFELVRWQTKLRSLFSVDKMSCSEYIHLRKRLGLVNYSQVQS